MWIGRDRYTFPCVFVELEGSFNFFISYLFRRLIIEKYRPEVIAMVVVTMAVVVVETLVS